MAEGKKSFLIYCDIIKAIDHLTDEEKGRLFQHLLEYVNDMNPILEDRLLIGCWKPIELQLKRDLIKYESIKDRNAKNGAKGGRPSKPKKPIGLIGNPQEPKKADTDNDTVNDTVIERESKSPHAFQNISSSNKTDFLKWFSEVREKETGLPSNFNTLYPEQQTDLFNLKKSYTFEDFNKSLKSLCQDKWAKDNNCITPKHFLNLDNFSKYLNTETKNEGAETLQQRAERLTMEERNR